MMLKEGVRDHSHQCVAMQAWPRATFEVVEAEFFVEFVRKVPRPRASALSSAQLRYATIAGHLPGRSCTKIVGIGHATAASVCAPECPGGSYDCQESCGAKNR